MSPWGFRSSLGRGRSASTHPCHRTKLGRIGARAPRRAPGPARAARGSPNAKKKEKPKSLKTQPTTRPIADSPPCDMHLAITCKKIKPINPKQPRLRGQPAEEAAGLSPGPVVLLWLALPESRLPSSGWQPGREKGRAGALEMRGGVLRRA